MGVLIYYYQYYQGETPQGPDLVQAYKWFKLGMVNDGEGSVTYHSRKMTPDQLAEAERLVAEWEPNPAECETIGAQAEN